MRKYYKLRRVGQERYFVGKRQGTSVDNDVLWSSANKGALFTQHQLNLTLRYWKRHNLIDLDTIQIVEYDLLERRGLSFDDFFIKYGKTPIL